MAITAQRALDFSNDQLRPSSDRNARSFYRAVAVANRWAALGSGQAALDQMQADLKSAANEILDSFETGMWTEYVWNQSVSALVPNDTTQLWDNSITNPTAQDPSRPPLTGARMTNAVVRCQQFRNWLLSSTGSFTDPARDSVALMNTVIQCSRRGTATIVLADAGNLINRCSELVTNYQASTNANLTTVLVAAVNPTPQGNLQ